MKIFKRDYEKGYHDNILTLIRPKSQRNRNRRAR